MAKARVIVKRRAAVRNIRKITQTMQLIATARFQKCMQRAVASRPYTRKITELIEALAGQQAIEHPLLKPNAAKGRSILLVISSNRGLCGAYNASVLRRMIEQRKKLSDAGIAAAMVVFCGVLWLHTPTGPSARLSPDVNNGSGRVLAADYNGVRPADINALDSNGLN